MFFNQRILQRLKQFVETFNTTFKNESSIKILFGEDIKTLENDEVDKWKQKLNICHTINGNYALDTISKCIDNIYNEQNDNIKYDVAIIFSNHIVFGFVIIEFEECNIEPYEKIPVLNLLCGNEKVASSFPVAKALVYMYVYTMYKKYISYRYGILELADNYFNSKALCLYYKFGFREDLSMKHAECFPDGLYDNYSITIPMKIDLHDPKINDSALFNVVESKGAIMELSNDAYFGPEILCNTSVPKQEREAIVQERIRNLDKIMKMKRTYTENQLSKALEYNGVEVIEGEDPIYLLGIRSIHNRIKLLPFQRKTRKATESIRVTKKRKTIHKSKTTNKKTRKASKTKVKSNYNLRSKSRK